MVLVASFLPPLPRKKRSVARAPVIAASDLAWRPALIALSMLIVPSELKNSSRFMSVTWFFVVLMTVRLPKQLVEDLKSILRFHQENVEYVEDC